MTFPDQRVAKNIQFNDFFGDKEPRISVEKVKIPEFQRNYVWDVQKAKNLFDSIQDNEFHYI